MAIVYETPANTRTYIKDIMVTNHSGASGAAGLISIHIVQAGGDCIVLVMSLLMSIQ